MFGDIVLFLKEKWTQFWCIHDYKYRDLPANCSHFYCTKCGKIKNKVIMAQYIDKDALVAWAKETYLCENASMIRKVCYKQLLEHLNTLEVKEVDLEAEWKKYFEYRGEVATVNVKHLAKHFFELALSLKNN